jgi:hypothetical protein
LILKKKKTKKQKNKSEEKLNAMRKKDLATTTATLGIRITAMKVLYPELVSPDEKTLVPKLEWRVDTYNKAWGKKVTDKTMEESLELYFRPSKIVRLELIPKFLEKLKQVKNFMENQRKIRIYSSSLLFIYDADQHNDHVDLRM